MSKKSQRVAICSAGGVRDTQSMCLFPMSPDAVSDYPSQLFYDLRKLSAINPAEGLRDFVKDHWMIRFVRPAPLDYAVGTPGSKFATELRGNTSLRKGRAKLWQGIQRRWSWTNGMPTGPNGWTVEARVPSFPTLTTGPTMTSSELEQTSRSMVVAVLRQVTSLYTHLAACLAQPTSLLERLFRGLPCNAATDVKFGSLSRALVGVVVV
ncbi:hypothetical protein FA13DRAFT_1710810 [Coprinellus micaceus]|uniref:Uncharacterized protein n=1 Tax=Coprinellus micaceus TaxID=71717 RepID=A0A4Y7T7M8_COPMI|nr:hypothetical protein FA13DRAFT_1710810 [Coprinellus micaceus]